MPVFIYTEQPNGVTTDSKQSIKRCVTSNAESSEFSFTFANKITWQ